MSELTAMMNIGKEMARKLTSVGIDTPEKLIELGSMQAFRKLKEAYPQMCLVHLYTLEGAIFNTEYNRLPEDKKKELKVFSDSLKSADMAKVIMVCGKICSGKSTYAERLRKKNSAVLLSIDEIMLSMFGQYVGEMHDEYVSRTKKYLFGKSLEIIDSGINVVLDWGVWTKAERAEAREFYESRGIGYELHYIDVSDVVWRERVAKRNNAISEGRLDAYYVDENLAAKFGAIFEPPTDKEIDIRVPAYEIRKITGDEIDGALELALEVFMEFEAPDYKPEGAETFKSFIRNGELINGFKQGICPIYAAFDGGKIIGMMGMRKSKTHINLAFVKKEYHRRGVATAIFNYLLDDLRRENPSLSEITLNSSPYGMPFYLSIGFVTQSDEQEADGMRFTPMKYTI